jgi:orotate phosphoribosyltransferase
MRERLIQYVEEHSFLQSEEPVFLLASGKRSKVYFDLRLTTLSPEGQYLIGTSRPRDSTSSETCSTRRFRNWDSGPGRLAA